MAEYGGFFNSSVDEPRQYQDIDFARMLSLLTGGQGYVVGYLNELKVALGDEGALGEGSDISIDTGAAWVGEPAGWWYINNEASAFTIDHEEAAGTNRIDRVVIRLDRTSTELIISANVKKGTSGTSPTAPSLTQDDLIGGGHIYEISLAQILVTGGLTTLELTDERTALLLGSVSKNIIKTTSFVLTLEDINSFIRCDNASGIEVTVPASSAANFPECTDITLFQEGAGQITVQPGSGITIYADGYAHDATDETFKSNGRYEALTLRKIGEDSWVAVGAITTDEA